MPELRTSDCRYLAFFMIDGQLLARASTPEGAIETAIRPGLLDNADALEVLDCGQEGRKIWLQNRGAGMPILLSTARKRHATVYRGAFYDNQRSQLPAIPLMNP
jgi:hypothetical protein